MHEFGNKSSKYLAYLVGTRSDSEDISAIKDETGKIVHYIKDINRSFQVSYESLYKSETVPQSEALMQNFLSAINLPQASQTQKDLLNSLIA